MKYEQFGFISKITQLNITKYQLNQLYATKASSKVKKSLPSENLINSCKSMKLVFNQESIALMLGNFDVEIRKIFSELWTKLDKEYSKECLFCGNMIIDWAFEPFELDNQIFKI